MTDKAHPAGWVVQETIEGASSFKYFNVAIADAAEAVRAVIKFSDTSMGRRMDAIRALSESEIASIPLKPGGVKPA